MSVRTRVVGWAVLCAVVIGAIVRVDWSRVIAIAARADVRWLAAAVLVNGLLIPVTALQWRLLMAAGVRASLADLLAVVGRVAAVSNGLHAWLGYPAALQQLSSRLSVSRAAAVALLTWEYLSDTVARIGVVLVVLALAPLAVAARPVTPQAAALLLAIAALVVLHPPRSLGRTVRAVARRHPAVADRCIALAQRIPVRPPSPGAPRIAGALVASVAKRGVESAAVALVATALGVPIPAWACLAAPLAASMAQVVAVTPAALGVYEAGAFAVFRLAGLGTADATAMAILAHVTYLLPMVGASVVQESASLASRRTTRAALLGFVLVVAGLAIHGWYVAGADAANSDAALVVLMARAFAAGHWSIYFWQQNWMANFEPLILTPLAMRGWATPTTASAVALGLTAVLAWMSLGLARRARGVSWTALLIWAVPPALVVHHHVTLYGARLTATLLAVGAFAWSFSARRRRGWLGVGALCGIAFAGDHLMIVWALATLFVAGRRGALPTVVAGAIPFVVADAIAAVMTPAFHLVGPNFPRDWPRNIPLLLDTVLPQLLGLIPGRGPGPVWEAAPPAFPHDLRWVACLVPGVAIMVAIARTLARQRWRGAADETPEAMLVRQGLLLAIAAALGLFVLVGGGGETWSVRYLVPLWPGLSVLAAVAVAEWPRHWRPAAALVVLPSIYTIWTDQAWPRAEDAAPARNEAAAVHAAVLETGVRFVWADYWDSYRMLVLAGPKPRWLAYSVIERRPEWAREARSAGPVGYLVREGDRGFLAALDTAEAHGIARVTQRTVGRYQLVVMARHDPGIDSRNGWPSVAKQRLAALSASGLFLGASAFVALLPLGGAVFRRRRAPHTRART